MTGPANQQYQFAPSKPVNKMNSETQGNGNTTEPFYPTIPPPPEAAPQPSNHLYQPHPDFHNLQPPNFNSDSMLQVNNPNLGYPTSSPSDHQPFRPVPQEEAQNDSGPSGSRVWKSGDSHRCEYRFGSVDAQRTAWNGDKRLLSLDTARQIRSSIPLTFTPRGLPVKFTPISMWKMSIRIRGNKVMR